MDTPLNDGNPQGNADQRPSIDPLRCAPLDPLKRVFVPIERVTAKGTRVFKTTDGDIYARLSDGSIRRAHPKVNGKIARRARRMSRKGCI